MNIELIISIFTMVSFLISIILCIGFASTVAAERNSLNSLYLQYSSSARAGGSGMVFNEDGEISNSLSVLECEKKAEYYFNIPDSEIKNKVLIRFIFEGMKLSIIYTSVIILVIFIIK